jgi:hypothetical protein
LGQQQLLLHGMACTCPALLLPQLELKSILKDYVGRETPLYYAERLSMHYQK